MSRCGPLLALLLATGCGVKTPILPHYRELFPPPNWEDVGEARASRVQHAAHSAVGARGQRWQARPSEAR